MDSLKLDRFRRLLNRQYTSINLNETSNQINNLPASTTATSATTPTSSSLPNTCELKPAQVTNNSITNKETITANLPNYVTKDNPKPAIFLARKLFADFVELVDKKIHNIQAQEQPKVKPIFKTFQSGEDIIYDQILQGLGVISEFCLPSLLRLLLAWYQHQLGVGPTEDSTSLSNSIKRPQSALENHNPLYQQQQQHQQLSQPICEHQQSSADCSCSSPCVISEPNSLSETTITNQNHQLPIAASIVRSSTPSSPDTTSNQISITSSLSLEYNSPASLATIIQNNSIISNADATAHQSSSTANTSTSTATNVSSSSLDDSANVSKRSESIAARKVLVEFALCQALIEIFNKLNFHPGQDELMTQIEDIAFSHFKPIDMISQSGLHGVDTNDVCKLADKFAEVIGVIAVTRFRAVKKRFFSELNELRSKDSTPANIQAINALLSSMRYFRVKMAPIEEFEASFQFLQECAEYFIDLRHKSIKHSLAELFVEIMLPLASTVKNEVKIPCLKNFVETLWPQTLDMCNRKKHSTTLYPLVTCLLCVSQKTIFLQNWGSFLNMCLSNLKNRDQKMCRIALESLYRLVWVYMIRVKCESNNITQARLLSIVDAMFPKGSRQIVPRDTPLNIYVDIIHFIAQERLDFAMRNIIFDLLPVDRQIKIITAPERLNIGIQAFLVIADSLQQKEGEPIMPMSIDLISQRQNDSSLNSSLSMYRNDQFNHNNNNNYYETSPSGLLRRAQHSFHNKMMLNDDIAKSIGLHPYYNHIQKSFNEMLKALDTQLGKPLLLTVNHNLNKEPEDIITGDMRPKVELFKTCIAAIPRLMPDGMSKAELIELLSRMTIHIDAEMRRYAFESLQILVTDFQDWRLDAVEGFTLFLANQIDESMRGLTDNALKMLLQLLIGWRKIITSSFSSSNLNNNNNSINSQLRSSVVSIQTGYETISSRNSSTGGQIVARKNRALAEMRLIQGELSNTPFDRLVNVIQKVEGASLVMLCSYHQQTRKYATQLLRECRSILKCYSSWTCMDQFGLRSPDDVDEDDLSASIKGSLSADNLSRITATSATGPAHSSVTSMNTQPLLTTSASRMCISSTGGGGGGGGFHQQQGLNNNNHHHLQQHHPQHDLYDEDVENNLLEGYTNDDSSTLIFWVAIMMLESNKEQEYMFALRLLKKILPNLPFEQQDFLDELEENLKLMQWDDFPGLHALIVKGCASQSSYDLCITLLDHLTPILKHSICTAACKPEHCLPIHILVLSTHLISTYDDPTPFSLNIARRLAMCCQENSQKLENLSAVLTLYSRRSFSKDAFQWIKCVVKYLHDAYSKVLPNAIPLFVDLLESGPQNVQRLVAPILYCMLAYIDVNQQPQQQQQQQQQQLLQQHPRIPHLLTPVCLNNEVIRIYNNCLGSQVLWRDALQLFKLIISKSSQLTDGSQATVVPSGTYGRELPGRTMEFTLDIDCLPVIANSHLINESSVPLPVNVGVNSGGLGGGTNLITSQQANTCVQQQQHSQPQLPQQQQQQQTSS